MSNKIAAALIAALLITVGLYAGNIINNTKKNSPQKQVKGLKPPLSIADLPVSANLAKSFDELKRSGPNFKVASLAEFSELNLYYRELLVPRPKDIDHWFYTAHGDYIQCIKGNLAGLINTYSVNGGSLDQLNLVQDGKTDELGNVRKCADKTVPILMPAKANLYHFANKRELLTKYPITYSFTVITRPIH